MKREVGTIIECVGVKGKSDTKGIIETIKQALSMRAAKRIQEAKEEIAEKVLETQIPDDSEIEADTDVDTPPTEKQRQDLSPSQIKESSGLSIHGKVSLTFANTRTVHKFKQELDKILTKPSEIQAVNFQPQALKVVVDYKLMDRHIPQPKRLEVAKLISDYSRRGDIKKATKLVGDLGLK